MTSQPTVLILNGPNLNLLGVREPDIYGRETLADVERRCTEHADTLGLAIDFRQSNTEGVLVDAIQESRGKHAGLIINAGAYTHTSVAIHDALKALDSPVLEVHLSNPYTREEFRHTSYVAPAAIGSICGLGIQGYELALTALARLIREAN